MSKRPADPDEFQMSIGDHIEELRLRMVLALGGVGIALVLTLWFGRPLIAWLCQPLAHALKSRGLAPQTYAFGPATSFTIYLKVCFVAALIVASPWILYQAWKFVEVGLYKTERRVVLVLAPFSSFMTLLGVLFMYYVMVPVCLVFFIGFAAGYPPIGDSKPSFLFNLLTGPLQGEIAPNDYAPPGTSSADSRLVVPRMHEDPPNPSDGQIWLKDPEQEVRLFLDGKVRTIPLATTSLMSPLIEIGQYLGFVTMLAIGIVVAFQTPVIMLIAGWSGIVEPQFLARYRGYCVFACFALGMLLTPSDVLSMLLLAFPLWGLFELGLILMRIVQRSRAEA